MALLCLGALCAWWLQLSPSGLLPREGGVRLAGQFFARALTPAWDYETPPPEGTPPLVMKALEGARRTVVFAAAGMSLALVFGLLRPLKAVLIALQYANSARLGRLDK